VRSNKAYGPGRPLSPGILGSKVAAVVAKGQHELAIFNESEVRMTKETTKITESHKNAILEKLLALVHCLAFVLTVVDFGGSLC